MQAGSKQRILTWGRVGCSPGWDGAAQGAGQCLGAGRDKERSARERRVPAALSWGRLEHGTGTMENPLKPPAKRGELIGVCPKGV